MTGNELQAARKLLMLDVAEAARWIGGAAPRSWRYWEAGRSPVPHDVQEKILAAIQQQQNIAGRIGRKALAYGENPNTGKTLIVPYHASIESWRASRRADDGVVAWRCHQSAVSALYAEGVVNLK